MKRSVIGVSAELHAKLRDLSKTVGVPLTKMLEHWVDHCSEQQWDLVKEDYENNKPSWKNIRKTVKEYMEKYPDADDKRLSELTGFSTRQVETITQSAHKRCIAYMRGNTVKDPNTVSEQCNVSIKFATRMCKQFESKQKIPKSEEHLWQ